MSSTDPFVSTLQEFIEVVMHRSMHHVFHFARENGLTMPQIGVLFSLTKGGTSGISNISEDLGITSAAGSQMLDRLVQQEIILRTEDPSDRRVKKIVLTDKGRRILKESSHLRQAWMEDLTKVLSPAEKEQIVAAAKIVIDRVNQTPPTGK